MNLHVIIGSDDYLVNEAVKKLISPEAGLEVIDSLNATNADLQMNDLRQAEISFATPPFLEPTKVTWWKNVVFLPGGPGKKESSEQVKTELEAFAKKLVSNPMPENQVFILSAPGLLKTSIFAKTLMTGAEFIDFGGGKKKAWELEKEAHLRVEERAREMGLAFEPGVTDKFVKLAGTDTRSLVSELNKLRDYLGPNERIIHAADVDAVSSTGAFVEPEIWAVTDGLGERNLGKALTALRKFELQDRYEILISTVVEKFFRQLIDLKRAEQEDRLQDAAAELGMNPFAVRKNAAFLSRWSLIELRVARARFMKLREDIVSGTTDGQILLVTEMARVCRRVGARK